MDAPNPQAPFVGDQRPFVGNGPVALDAASARRTEEAVRWVEGTRRLRASDGRHRNTPMNAGVWAILASGTTISAASGTSLGSGTVQLADRSGTTLTGNGTNVTVYNAGGSVTASGGDMAVKLGWTDGDWSLDVVKC